MNPQRITETVEVVYWSCGEQCTIRHKTKAAAEACTKARSPKQKRWTDERRQEVLALKKSGKTYRELGELYGLSAGRMQQLVTQTIRRNQYRLQKDARFDAGLSRDEMSMFHQLCTAKIAWGGTQLWGANFFPSKWTEKEVFSLCRKGLLELKDDADDRWIVFTDAGKALAEKIGEPIEPDPHDKTTVKPRATRPGEPASDD